MVDTVKCCRENKMDYKVAIKIFQVPKATLKNYVKKKSPFLLIKWYKLEEMLVEYFLKTENNFYGLTVRDLS